MNFSTILFNVAMVPVWLLFSYVVIAVLEWWGHAVLMHQRTWLCRLPGRLGRYFDSTWDEHSKFHHGKCFPRGGFTRGAEDQCMILNIDLKPLTGLLASIPIWGPLLWFFPVGGCIFIASVLFHHTVWGIVHRQMHTPKEERKAWFNNSPFLLYLARYHCMHHFYPRKNHSILFILPDYLFGTYSAPSEKDVEEMMKLGLYPDGEKPVGIQ